MRTLAIADAAKAARKGLLVKPLHVLAIGPFALLLSACSAPARGDTPPPPASYNADQVKAATKDLVTAIHKMDEVRVQQIEASDKLYYATTDAERTKAKQLVSEADSHAYTAWYEVGNAEGKLEFYTGLIAGPDIQARADKLDADARAASKRFHDSNPMGPDFHRLYREQQQALAASAEAKGAAFAAQMAGNMRVTKECLANPLAKGCSK